MRNDKGAGVVLFDGIGELADYYERNGMHVAAADAKHIKWTGGWSPRSALQSMRDGDTSAVAEAQRLLQQFSMEARSLIQSDVPTIAGQYACVPEAIMGEPECMREPEWEETVGAPLTMIVDLSCSANIAPQHMRTRGVAVLAAVMALCADRPVQLYVSVFMGTGSENSQGDQCSAALVRVDTAPLDLATAAMMLSDVGFARRVMYQICRRSDLGTEGNGKWPTFHGESTAGQVETDAYKDRIKHYARLVGIDGEVLVMPPVFRGKHESPESVPSIGNPQQWVRDTVAAFLPQHAA